ncbi:DUF1272 domain-containing protein [Chryseobacterium bernardetii]|uniref:DUF1272 domain-containing protein n=1 Tax=Chryseobacterium bernardetii TaxID=1241978 RepID=UPI000F51030F|nr:DUF1272 domain-containing protein [Chryseobacterium bernardetii]AZB36197.1 DUF1272 domain-containing protein [Chryseobacterium bernardetii]
MLEIRTSCENCRKPLPYDSSEAMICTFECTFCKDCVDRIFKNVCPNCGGGLEKRPIRPKSLLAKYPVSTVIVYQPINEAEFKIKQERLIDIPLGER